MKDKARLIVGGVIIVASIAAAAVVAIFKPDALSSLYMFFLAAAILGYFVAVS